MTTQWIASSRLLNNPDEKIRPKTQNQNKGGEDEPALFPVVPAFFSPIFLMIKLEPMKTLEETARMSPVTLSLDIPICHNEQKKSDTQKKWSSSGEEGNKQLQGQDVQ